MIELGKLSIYGAMQSKSAENAMGRFRRAVQEYLRNMEATGQSALSVKNTAGTLEQFRAFWEEIASGREPQGPGFPEVKAWRDHLVDRGLQPRTVEKYLTRLGTFFSYASDPCLGEGRYYESNPVSKRLKPDMRKVESRPYDLILTDEQAMKLWCAGMPAGRKTHYREWPRNYAIVVMFLATEIRNSELRALRLGDLDFEHGELTVERGKGGKFRVVDFPKVAQTAVLLYLRSEAAPPDRSLDTLLFGHTKNGLWGPFTMTGISAMVERHVRSVTGVGGVTSHDLRHVGARLDLNNGMRFEELQSKLGHSSVATTQIYSGRLTARRGQQRAQEVFVERDRQTRRNEEVLAGYGPPAVTF